MIRTVCCTFGEISSMSKETRYLSFDDQESSFFTTNIIKSFGRKLTDAGIKALINIYIYIRKLLFYNDYSNKMEGSTFAFFIPLKSKTGDK